MKICIVGGGTAGWLAALFISKIKPEHSVEVIESSAIDIIGAGEGSTGALVDVLNGRIWDFGCNEIEFLKETGASLKYGILHKGWTADTEHSYFAPLGGTATSGSLLDFAYAYGHSHFSDKVHLTTSLGMLVEHGYSNLNKNTFQFVRTNSVGHALHFDARKVGQYFKKISLLSNNVTHIDSEVTQVNLNELGCIKSLLLTSGKEIYADFFIDASGFKRVLMSALGEKWCSYKDQLPVNSALPFILDYDNLDEMPEPYTTAWAQDAGWMWQIPQQHRKGCGYVFCDDFITPDQAHAEIENRLKRKITPIRTLKFETGRLNNVWNKNCLAVGLSAAFAEPLEATSIHSTIAQLYAFVFEFLKSTLDDTTNPGSIKLYNNRISRLYDDYKDFLIMHYMGGRTDTEFWKFISSGSVMSEKVNMLIETSKSRMPSTCDVPDYFGSAGWGLWSFVMGGIGKLSKEICYKDLITNNIDLNTSLLSHSKQFMIQTENDFNLLKQDLMSYKNFVNFIRN
jgi:tryptophan halogenase